MRKLWWAICVFFVGCLAGSLLLYSSVHDRIVTVPEVGLTGEVEGMLQTSPFDASVIGVQLYNGMDSHVVITRVWDAQGQKAEFTQLHMANLVGSRGYHAAGQAVPLSETIEDRGYAVLLPGDNAVLKFSEPAKTPVTVEYYLAGKGLDTIQLIMMTLN